MKNLMKSVLGVILVILMAFIFSGCDNLIGADGPAGTDGADGNMDVVLHQFSGNDFTINGNVSRLIPGFTSEAQVEQTNFLVELVYYEYSSYLYYQIPGPGLDQNSLYRKYKEWDSSNESAKVWIKKYEGLGENYVGINITVFPSGSIIDYRSISIVEFEELATMGLLPEPIEIIMHK